MPKLNIDQFENEPKVGDKVRVEGKVESIDTDSGEVEVSYDDVKIVGKKSSSDNEKSDEDMSENDNSQSLDKALSQAFPQIQ